MSQTAIIIVRRGVQEYRARWTQRETRLVGFDWTRVLQPGDEIAQANWAPEDGALTVAVSEVATAYTSALVSGGIAGQRYRVTCTIETTAGEIRQAEIELDVVAADAAGATWFVPPYTLAWDDGEEIAWDDGVPIEFV